MKKSLQVSKYFYSDGIHRN